MPCGAACTSGTCCSGPAPDTSTVLGALDPSPDAPGSTLDTLGLCGTPRPVLGALEPPHQTPQGPGLMLCCCFFSIRKRTKARMSSKSLYKSHAFSEVFSLQRGKSRGGGASQDGALALLHPRVVLHQVGVQERVLGDPILDPLEEPVCGRVGRGR